MFLVKRLGHCEERFYGFIFMSNFISCVFFFQGMLCIERFHVFILVYCARNIALSKFCVVSTRGIAWRFCDVINESSSFFSVVFLVKSLVSSNLGFSILS